MTLEQMTWARDILNKHGYRGADDWCLDGIGVLASEKRELRIFEAEAVAEAERLGHPNLQMLFARLAKLEAEVARMKKINALEAEIAALKKGGER